MKHLLKKIWKRHYLFEICLGLILILIAAAIAWISLGGYTLPSLDFFKKNKTTETAPASPEIIKQVRRAIDGLLVEEGKEKPPLAAVMIENMVEAQPISGIDKANLVFEAVTEANITRFLAFYPLDDSLKDFEIGPVRSARPYYLDWTAELGALYAHVGSSPGADRLIKKGIVQDLDQWFKSQYFNRVSWRPGPHNIYTTVDLLKQALAEVRPLKNPQGLTSAVQEDNPAGWLFKDDAPSGERGKVGEIKIDYVAPYDVVWRYDKENNEYVRYQWGLLGTANDSAAVSPAEKPVIAPHKTADGSLIKAKNIVVVWQEMKVLDEVGRKWFGTIGEGKAIVFRDGQAIQGIWRKPSRSERMRFFDASGNEVVFNAGTTWVEIAPVGYGVEY